MELSQRIESWTATHYPAWFDIMRMLLGIFLFVKGFIVLSLIGPIQTFIENINLLNNSNLDWNAQILVQFIAYTHIIGGFFITVGFLTRLIVFFQVPILMGAVLFTMPGFKLSQYNNLAQGGITFVWSELNTQASSLEWWTALFTLILLVSCFIVGSGPWSVDKYLKHYEEE